MQELLDRARALGEAIANHPRVRAFMAARAKAEQDSEAQQLLKAYEEQAQHVRRLEAEQKPIEVADKRKLAECEQKMASNEALKELMRTQVDYVTLMNRVNQAMEAPLAGSRQSGGAS
ncbi:MAG: YlbF family regulator [Phycisphaerae bacterium]